jgi:hypothetical protein
MTLPTRSVAVHAKFGGPERPEIELILAESDTERTRLYIEADLGSITIENLRIIPR